MPIDVTAEEVNVEVKDTSVDVELTKQSIVNSVNTISEITKMPAEMVIDGYKREYAIVGDALFTKYNTGEVPDWLAAYAQQAFNLAIDGTYDSLVQANQNIIQAINDMEIAKNSYVSEVGIYDLIDGRLAVKLETLNATYDSNYANYIDIVTQKVTADEALSIAATHLNNEVNRTDGTSLGGQINNIKLIATDTQSSLASIMDSLESSIEDINGDLIANATATDLLSTYVSEVEANAVQTTTLDSLLKDPTTGEYFGAGSEIGTSVSTTIDGKINTSFKYNANLKTADGKYYTPGFGLDASYLGGDGSYGNPYTSKFYIRADRFYVTNSNDVALANPVFSISGSDVQFNGKVSFNSIKDTPINKSVSVISTQYDYSGNASIRVNDTVYNTNTRGHTLIVWDPVTNSHVSGPTTFDTYASDAIVTQLAQAIENVVDGKMVILSSFDATRCKDDLRAALVKCGSKYKYSTWTGTRIAHAFVGIKGSVAGAGIEIFKEGVSGRSIIDTYFTSTHIETDPYNVISLASEAQEDADTANELLADIAADSKLTSVEKLAIKKEWLSIVEDHLLVIDAATEYDVAIIDCVAEYNNLNDYLNNPTTGLLVNLESTSVIDREDFTDNFKYYYQARTALWGQINVKLSSNAFTSAKSYTDDLVNSINVPTTITSLSPPSAIDYALGTIWRQGPGAADNTTLDLDSKVIPSGQYMHYQLGTTSATDTTKIWKQVGGTYIDGSNIITGTIDANLATITNINASNITSGVISSTGLGTSVGVASSTIMDSKGIRVYDAAGTLRVKIGNLT